MSFPLPPHIVKKLPIRNSWELINKKLLIPLPIHYYFELIREVLANTLYVRIRRGPSGGSSQEKLLAGPSKKQTCFLEGPLLWNGANTVLGSTASSLTTTRDGNLQFRGAVSSGGSPLDFFVFSPVFMCNLVRLAGPWCTIKTYHKKCTIKTYSFDLFSEVLESHSSSDPVWVVGTAAACWGGSARDLWKEVKRVRFDGAFFVVRFDGASGACQSDEPPEIWRK